MADLADPSTFDILQRVDEPRSRVFVTRVSEHRDSNTQDLKC